MAKDLTDYQAQVGRAQDADGFFCKTAAGGALAFFEELDATAQQAMLGILSWQTMRIPVEAGLSAAGAISNLASGNYGVYPLVASTGASLATLKLPVPRKGAVLVLNFDACVTDGNYSVLAQSGGGLASVSMTNAAGTGLSSFDHSAAGTVVLLATTANNWAVVQADASATVHLDT